MPILDTLKGVDDLIRTDLEVFREIWFNRLLAATLLVVIGLAMEGPELWYEISSIFRHGPFVRRFHFSLPEQHAPNWVKLLAFVGWVLIVGGVAGEYVADSFASKADGYVQKFDEILLADTTRNAGDAATSARIAREESTAAKTEADAAKLSAGEALTRAHAAEGSLAKAEDDAGKAQTAAAGALTTATDASTRAGKAEASLGRAEAEAKSAESSAANALILAREARQEAASFESDLARLKQQAADRVLDEYQQEQIRLRVEPFLGSPYELAVADTPEATILLIEIDAAVDSAGWLYKASESKAFRRTKKLHNGHEVEEITLKGVEIGLSPALWVKLKPAADALAKALNSAGITAFVLKLPEDDPSPNNIHIMVGSKP
jgi:hypothetical protein